MDKTEKLNNINNEYQSISEKVLNTDVDNVELKVDGLKVDGLKVDGLKVDGLKVGGLKVDGLKVDGLGEYNLKTDVVNKELELLNDTAIDITDEKYRQSMIHNTEENQLSFHDAYELISKKILINKITQEVLKKQIRFSSLSVKLQKYAIDIAKSKQKCISTLDELLEKQLSNPTSELQNECLKIYDELYKLDILTPEYMDLMKSMDTLRNEMINLTNQADAIEKTIPVEQLITKYKVNMK